MNKKVQSVLSWFLNPAAIGIYTAILITASCFYFYIGHASNDANLINRLHQVSIDGRLQFRGPRPGSSQVALLVVDEKAVNTIGRWPWPRETLAKAIDKAFEYGANVLAFDMVFSEPSKNVAREIYEKVHGKYQLPGDVDQVILTESQRLDGDQALADTFAKHADHIVAGSFSDDIQENDRAPGWINFCRGLIFKKSPAAKLWDHEDVLLTPQDPFEISPPAKFTEIVSAMLDLRADALKEELKASNVEGEKSLAQKRINDDLNKYCLELMDGPDLREDLEKLWTTQVLPSEDPNKFKFKTYASWLEDFKTKTDPSNPITVASDWTLNIPKLVEKTKHTGYFNAFLDSDGMIRSSQLLMRSGRNYFPSLALKAYLVATQQNADIKLGYNAGTNSREVSQFGIANSDTGDLVYTVPTDGRSSMMINYAGPGFMFPHLSLADLLTDGDEAQITFYDPKSSSVSVKKIKKAEWIKDKIFIVGATAIGIYDLRVTPFQKDFPGAETHANVVSNLMTKQFMRPWRNEQVNMPIIVGVLGLALSLIIAQLGALGGLLTTATLMGGLLAFDQFYLFNNGIVTTIVWPMALIVGVFVTMTFYRYFTEERGKKELRQTFQKYVSPAIVEEILSDPKNIELGGRKAQLTVMFSDVRGFTTISEKLDPRALSDLLNSYLTPMTELVFKNRGTLDKYMGDAIMAFFGAPISYPDHAKHACRCALQSVAKLYELQQEYERKGLPRIDIGIGLNSGEVSVGNMGSETVRSYTVMGDAVNLASRLEGINKQYGTRIILSEFTYAQVKDDFVCREVDWVRVKGKALPVKIFELIAEHKAPEQVTEVLKWFQEGYLKYHEKAWSPALEAFTKALNVRPDDEVSKVYLTRCQEYLVEPPPDDWDGVFVMKTK